MLPRAPEPVDSGNHDTRVGVEARRGQRAKTSGQGELDQAL